MQIEPTTLVSDVAAHHPATVRTFERHGIDFCCHGRRPLEEVCAAEGLELGALLQELEADLAAPPAEEEDWTAAPLSDLADHIVSHYHGKLRDELPRLSALQEKVLEAHGERHGEMLSALGTTFGGLRAELELHMQKEEAILFPFIRDLEAASTRGGFYMAPPFGSVEAPVGMMEEEHESAAAALVRMRQLTGGFRPPEDACNTFRALYRGLEELEEDLHRHIHLENNILFPRAVELEGRVQAH